MDTDRGAFACSCGDPDCRGQEWIDKHMSRAHELAIKSAMGDPQGSPPRKDSDSAVAAVEQARRRIDIDGDCDCPDCQIAHSLLVLADRLSEAEETQRIQETMTITTKALAKRNLDAALARLSRAEAAQERLRLRIEQASRKTTERRDTYADGSYLSGCRVADRDDTRKDSTESLQLEDTLVETYYVTDKALAMVPEGANRDDFLIELFEQHAGSVYCDELFYNDANPSVGREILEVDPDA